MVSHTLTTNLSHHFDRLPKATLQTFKRLPRNIIVTMSEESEDEIDDEQLEEYREMVEDLGTFPVSSERPRTANNRYLCRQRIMFHSLTNINLSLLV